MVTLAVRAGLAGAAAAAASGAAAGGIMYWLLPTDGSGAPVVVALASLAALLAYGAFYLVVKKRLGRAVPVIGAWRGAAIATAIFAVAVMLHSIHSPGASGFPISFIGQFVISFILVGWAAAVVGASLGMLIDKWARQAPNSTVERDGPQAARPSP